MTSAGVKTLATAFGLSVDKAVELLKTSRSTTLDKTISGEGLFRDISFFVHKHYGVYEWDKVPGIIDQQKSMMTRHIQSQYLSEGLDLLKETVDFGGDQVQDVTVKSSNGNIAVGYASLEFYRPRSKRADPNKEYYVVRTFVVTGSFQTFPDIDVVTVKKSNAFHTNVRVEMRERPRGFSAYDLAAIWNMLQASVARANELAIDDSRSIQRLREF